MTDPRRLTDAALAAIGEFVDSWTIPFAPEGIKSRFHHLFRHIAWQGEQLAEAERENDKLKMFGSAAIATGGKLNADLATEKAARVAAEEQAVEMRTALETFANISNWSHGRWADDPEPSYLDKRFWWWDAGAKQVECPWDFATAALASPDRGASAPDDFTCDICGQHAIIGTVSGPGQPMRKRCAEHFPEVKDGAE